MEHLKLLKFPVIDQIHNRIEGLKYVLENSNEDYGYELIKLCIDYFSIYEPAEHVNDCEMCMRQALYHWINYCLENNIELPVMDVIESKEDNPPDKSDE